MQYYWTGWLGAFYLSGATVHGFSRLRYKSRNRVKLVHKNEIVSIVTSIHIIRRHKWYKGDVAGTPCFQGVPCYLRFNIERRFGKNQGSTLCSLTHWPHVRLHDAPTPYKNRDKNGEGVCNITRFNLTCIFCPRELICESKPNRRHRWQYVNRVGAKCSSLRVAAQQSYLLTEMITNG